MNQEHTFNLEVPRGTAPEFAVYTDPSGVEYPIEADWSQLHDKLDRLFDEEAHLAALRFEEAVGIQHGQKFGVKSAFGYLLDKANRGGRAVDLNEVVSDSAIDGTDYVRIAKARAAEAAFIAYYVNAASATPATSALTGGP